MVLKNLVNCFIYRAKGTFLQFLFNLLLRSKLFV